MYCQLSKLDLRLTVNQVIDYLLDNGYNGIVNDITGNQIEYDLDDVLIIWHQFVINLN